MFNFVFNKKEKSTLVVEPMNQPTMVKTAIRMLSPQQAANEVERIKAEKNRKSNEELAKRRRYDLDKPFGILLGDPSYHPVHNPNVEPPHIVVVHHSIPEFSGVDKYGQKYTHGLKTALRSSGDWVSKWHDMEGFSDNTDLYNFISKRKESGLEVFHPAPQKPISNAALAYTKLVEHGRKRSIKKKLIRSFSTRPRSSYNTQEETNPDNPLVAIKNRGKSAVSNMIDAVSQNAPFSIGNELCVCGSRREDHVTSEEYNQNYDEHLQSTGRRLKLHRYLEQNLLGDKNAVEFQYGASPLLKFKRRIGTGPVELGKAFDGEEDRHYIPMVKVSTRGIGFTRYTSYLKSKYGALQNLAANVFSDKKQCSVCKGTGKYDQNQSENSIACNHCSKGKIRYIQDVDSDGNNYLRKYTIGIGNGQFKYFDPKDAPVCNTCNGQGHLNGFECGTCEGTGHNITGTDCKNCESGDSILRLTPDNSCFTCEGKGSISTQYEEKRRYPRTSVVADEFEGNPTYASPADLSSGAINTGGILWKGSRNSNCKVCKDNHYLDPDTGLPCECRIAHPHDEAALPSNVRVIHPDGISIPLKHFQAAMDRLYGSPNYGNPHDQIYMPDVVDPETGKSPTELVRFGTGHWTKTDTGDAPHRYTGVVTPGKLIPKDVLLRLQAKSPKNWASPTAKWTAASADLEDVMEELKNFHTWDDNIPSIAPRIRKNIRKPASRFFKSGRIKTNNFPSGLKEPATELEQYVENLPDSSTGRYNGIMDDIYENHILSNHSDPDVREAHIPKLKEAKDRLFEAIKARHPDTTTTPHEHTITAIDSEGNTSTVMKKCYNPLPCNKDYFNAVEDTPELAPHLSELVDILGKFGYKNDKETTNV